MASLVRQIAPAVYSAEYGHALADHLPMAVSAIVRMGGSPERCRAFADSYIPSKHLRELGDEDVELVARLAVRTRIASLGRSAVLEEALPVLMRGVGAGAFHALIRVAYGVMDRDDDEIAAGLAYWTQRSLDLGDSHKLAPETATFDISSALKRVRTMLRQTYDSLPEGLIASRMARVAEVASFDEAVGRPAFTEASFADIAHVTVRLFAATRNFTVLHAMTATHALRILLPWLEDRDRALQCFWRAYVAAYVSAGAPELPAEDSFASDIAHALPWERIHAVARESADEHVIKAAFTGWQEDETYGDPMYRVAAMRYGRIFA